MSAPSRGCSSVGVSTPCRWQLMLSPHTCDSGAQLSGAPCQPNQRVLRLSQQGGQPMPRLRHILLNLAVVLTIAGALILSGCAATDGQATADDVNNKAFTFPNGTVFHPALTSATVLEFTDNANTFTLSSAGGCPPNEAGTPIVCTASGSNRFGSCILTVGSSTYTPEMGPQVNDVITLNPCNFDSTNKTLTVSNGSITATSNPAIARLVNATPSDL